MSRRYRTFLFDLWVPAPGVAGIAASLLLAAIPVAAQTPGSPEKTSSALAKPANGAASKTSTVRKAWTGRTPDGQPDLQGVWTNATLTPLERPADLAGKPVLTAEEAAAYQKQLLEAANRDKRQDTADRDVAGAYNEAWFDRGNRIVGTHRTSLVVDPPDGKIPAYTPEAQKRVDAARQHAVEHPADGPEDRSLSERCLIWGTSGPPMVPGPYNNNYQIVQGPGYVAIYSEMIHDARVIPLDGRPHLGPHIRQWTGDSRGHWEGDTLVVDTTDFNGKAAFRGSTANMHLTERFTRADADTILYKFTVDDPATFTHPWTAEIPMTKGTGAIYEYACHEGNYAMVDMLAGARTEEQKAGGGAARK
jgi:hypothetical protein